NNREGNSYRPFALNLESNTNIKIIGVPQDIGYGFGYDTTINLSAGTTLEYAPPPDPYGYLQPTLFNMDESGSSTLIYNLTDQDIDLGLMGYPAISGISAGDQITVVGATDFAYSRSSGDLFFFNDQGRT